MIYKPFLAGLIFTALSASAEDNTSLKFRIDRPCDGNANICVPSIYAEGDIELDSAEQFSTFYNSAKKNIKNKLPLNPTVILKSPGAR